MINGVKIGDAGYLDITVTPDDFIGTATVSFNSQNQAHISYLELK
jgi:hypothetical protein